MCRVERLGREHDVAALARVGLIEHCTNADVGGVRVKNSKNNKQVEVNFYSNFKLEEKEEKKKREEEKRTRKER